MDVVSRLPGFDIYDQIRLWLRASAVSGVSAPSPLTREIPFHGLSRKPQGTRPEALQRVICLSVSLVIQKPREAQLVIMCCPFRATANGHDWFVTATPHPRTQAGAVRRVASNYRDAFKGYSPSACCGGDPRLKSGERQPYIHSKVYLGLI